MADLQLRIMGEDNASAAFSGMGQSARAAGQVLIDFTKASVRAYAESERSQRQLALVAGQLTGAVQQQAAALAQANSVAGELTEGIATMLLRYGAAPGDIGATTQAVLDYAAATGTDAKAATEALTRGVESGTGQFKSLGLSIQATGDRSKDLALATEALAKKYGGAAASDAASLTGSLRAAEDAFEDIQKAFGGFITEVATKSGALGAITEELRNIAKGAELARRFLDAGGGRALLDSAKAIAFGTQEEVASARVAFNRAAATAVMPDMMAPVTDRMQAEALRRAAPVGGGGGRVSGGGADAGGGGGVMDFKNHEMDLRSTLEFDLNDVINSDSKDRERRFEEEAKAQAAGLKKHFEEMEKMAADAAKSLAAQQQQFAKAGADIGTALVNNITGALESLASGGEQDAGQILASILAGVLGTVGSVLGNILLPGIGGALGGALGGLAGAGVKALANGGQQQNITINTMDSRSTREFFESDGGRGYYNAQRTGRGQGGR